MDDKKKIRKGICRNYGECEKAVPGEIIEVEDGQPFECPDCHEPLTEVGDDGKPLKTGSRQVGGGKTGGNNGPKPIVYVIVAAVVVIIALIAWFLLSRSNSTDEKEITPVEIVDQPAVDSIVAEEPAEKEIAQPEETAKEPATNVNNNGNTGKNGGEANTSTGNHKLGYGTWKGSMKNGKPHGSGTMTYSSEKVIDPRDSKGRVAQPGEYIIGEWDNGNLVQGRWFKNDGSKEVIIIGKAG